MRKTIFLIGLFCLTLISCEKVVPYNPKYDEEYMTKLNNLQTDELIYFTYKFEDNNSITLSDRNFKTIIEVSPKPDSYVIRKNPHFNQRPKFEE